MKQTKQIALGGMLGAVAMTILFFGGMIPAATYVCPVLCMIVLQMVLTFCGKRIAWPWYFMISFLALLLGPDKEAAILLALLGYYPIIKPKMDKFPVPVVCKLVFFNAVIILMYTAVVAFLGLGAIVVENTLIGYGSLVLMLVLGNVTFFLLDVTLTRYADKFSRKKK